MKNIKRKICYSFSVFILLITINSITYAQLESDKQINHAIKLISMEEYDKAITALKTVLSENPENALALYHLGISQLNTQANKKGKVNIENALKINPEIDPKLSDYWLGIAYYQNLETQKAREKLNEYKSSLSEKSNEHAELTRIFNALKAIEELKKIKPEFYVETLPGKLNTPFSDHSPLISTDSKTLIFTSKNQEGSDKKEKKKGEFFENIYTVKLDGYLPIGSPENLSASINTDRHDASIQLFDNDNKMLLYRINNGGDIYMASRENGSWIDPRPLGKSINSKDYESHAFMLPDGKTMFFSSSRKSKNGSLNIYKTTIGKDGNWNEPELLGPEINSDEDEDCPFVTNDGKTIYFSSKGHNSIGGYDIFVSHWNEAENKWSEAKNLEMPINSVGDDMYFVLDNSESHGFFSSHRENGKGNMDIYYAGKILPAFIEGKISVENDETANVGEVKISLHNTTYGDKYDAISDEKGNFNTTLDANSEYELKLYSDNYKEGKEPFSTQKITVPRTKTVNETIKKEYKIPVEDYQKLETQYKINGILTTSDGNKVNGNIELIDSSTGKVLSSTKTEEGSFSGTFKSINGKNYHFKVLSNGHTFNDLGAFTTNKNYEIDKTLVIKLEENNSLVSSKKGYTFNQSVLFSTNSSTLNKSTENELQRVISSVKSGAAIEVLVEGYADNVGRSSYNLKLSKKRAKEVAKFLSKNGIDKKVVITKFYGEDNPIADNSTEIGRSKNRRVEIHIK